MDHYAADENYFTEEGIERGHKELIRKLEAKKQAHAQRKAQQTERASSSSTDGFSVRYALLIVLVALAAMAGGWVISLFVLA